MTPRINLRRLIGAGGVPSLAKPSAREIAVRAAMQRSAKDAADMLVRLRLITLRRDLTPDAAMKKLSQAIFRYLRRPMAPVVAAAPAVIAGERRLFARVASADPGSPVPRRHLVARRGADQVAGRLLTGDALAGRLGAVYRQVKEDLGFDLAAVAREAALRHEYASPAAANAYLRGLTQELRQAWLRRVYKDADLVAGLTRAGAFKPANHLGNPRLAFYKADDVVTAQRGQQVLDWVNRGDVDERAAIALHQLAVKREIGLVPGSMSTHLDHANEAFAASFEKFARNGFRASDLEPIFDQENLMLISALENANHPMSTLRRQGDMWSSKTSLP